MSPPTLTIVAASCGMDDSLEERFRLAAQCMRNNTTIKLSNDQKLEIYAYFKQVRTYIQDKFGNYANEDCKGIIPNNDGNEFIVAVAGMCLKCG